jgi:hypothetical protein
MVLAPALVRAGFRTHPCCGPAEPWCLACRHGPAKCECPQPVYAQPSDRPSASVQQRVRAAERAGVIMCGVRGQPISAADMDALDAAVRELAIVSTRQRLTAGGRR